MSDSTEKVYLETSAFNYFLRELRWPSFLGTRELQEQSCRELFASPVTIWELMLSRNVDSDFMLYAAQNLFSDRLLATPGEIVTRYLRNAYPENIANYSCFTEQDIGGIWSRMTEDNSVTLHFDQEELLEKTQFMRRVSNNAASIVRYPNCQIEQEDIRSLAEVVNTTFECLRDDGFLSEWENSEYDVEILAKLYVIWMLGIFVLRFDLYNSPIERFWEEENASVDSPMERLMYVTERYQELMHVGPIIQMAIMSYHQLQLGRSNRGMLLDSMHCIYTPYVHTVLTADDDFVELARREPYYENKVVHVRDLSLVEIPYIAR